MTKINKADLLLVRDKFSKLLFFLLLFIIPLNLGLHFVLPESFINGILIDYLVPTLYLQDITLFLIVLLNLGKVVKKSLKGSKYLLWFVFAVFLSTLNTEFFIISITHFLRLFLYVLFMFYVSAEFSYEKDLLPATKILASSVILLSLLASFQWRKQGAVFENYLYFGEQPYTVSTPGINIENYFGVARVPPYGTFRHPNIFAAYLSLTLFLILAQSKKSSFLKIALVLGVVTLFFTLSKFAWISFLLSVTFWYLLKQKSKMILWVLSVFIFFFAFSFFLPFFDNFTLINDHPSFYRRSDLLKSSYQLFEYKPLFGVGYGVSTGYVDRYLSLEHDLRFTQPPHNIYILILLESGIFAFIFFLIFFFQKLKRSKSKPLLLILILQILFLSSYDHYFFTIHQTQILFWFILGLL